MCVGREEQHVLYALSSNLSLGDTSMDRIICVVPFVGSSYSIFSGWRFSNGADEFFAIIVDYTDSESEVRCLCYALVLLMMFHVLSKNCTSTLLFVLFVCCYVAGGKGALIS